MENPLEQPVPDDPIERIHALARDIAYGAANGRWTAHLLVLDADGQGVIDDAGLKHGLSEKWGNVPNYYSVHLLVSFGYLTRRLPLPPVNPGTAYYDITEKAFALLEKRQKPPKIFISYMQTQSSALALLIEARLKLIDNNITVFIDKDLELGEEWKEGLKKRVQDSEFFICLLTNMTLTSTPVKDEIVWALESSSGILPICHSSYQFDPIYPDELKNKQVISTELLQKLKAKHAIIINPENAERYEQAIIKLLSRLGYSNVK